MKITIVNDKMFMAPDYYITRPMLISNMIISENPHLRKSPNRSDIHPIFRKCSYIR